MKKKLLPVLACLAGLTATAQDELTITAHLKQSPNDTLVTLFEPFSREVDTVRIKNHRFTIRKKFPKGGSAHILHIGSDVNNPGIVVYLEPGELKIKGNGPYFEGAEYSGSQFVKDWQYIDNNYSDLSPKYKGLADMQAKQAKALVIGDEETANAMKAAAADLEKKRKEELKKWVMDNPNSGVAAYVINVYLFKDKKLKQELLTILGPKAKASRIAFRMLNPGKDGNAPSFSMGGAKEKLPVGAMAPDFSSLDVNGKKVSLSDFKGKFVFVDFWASWCGPCKPQVPFLKQVYETHKSKDNFVMLGISLDNNRDAWTKAVASHQMEWLQLSELKGWKESSLVPYEVTFIPANVLIGPDGKILAKNLTNEALVKKMAELIK